MEIKSRKLNQNNILNMEIIYLNLKIISNYYIILIDIFIFNLIILCKLHILMILI